VVLWLVMVGERLRRCAGVLAGARGCLPARMLQGYSVAGACDAGALALVHICTHVNMVDGAPPCGAGSGAHFPPDSVPMVC
jgi:hypothetical protein